MSFEKGTKVNTLNSQQNFKLSQYFAERKDSLKEFTYKQLAEKCSEDFGFLITPANVKHALWTAGLKKKTRPRNPDKVPYPILVRIVRKLCRKMAIEFDQLVEEIMDRKRESAGEASQSCGMKLFPEGAP